MDKFFAGFSPYEIIDYTGVFNVVMDNGDSVYLESNDTFEYGVWDDDDFPNFEYRYVVEILDLTAYGAENNSVAVTLYMVPLLEYWHGSIVDSVKNQAGVCDLDSIGPFDLVMLGESPVRFWNEYITFDDEDWRDPCDSMLCVADIKDTLDRCASVLTILDRMRGFALDRSWNMIGTNGWDSLREILLGQPALQSSIERLSEKCV